MFLVKWNAGEAIQKVELSAVYSVEQKVAALLRSGIDYVITIERVS